jgi:glycyl-tRNA synthetase beta chain
MTLTSSIAQPLLIELFTEELPPKALAKLSAAFSEGIAKGLNSAGLVEIGKDLSPVAASFATPRRLSVRIQNVLTQGKDKQVEVKGPSTKVGLDADGKPTMALVKWAEKQGADVSQLTQANDGKQDCFYFKSTVRGASLDAVLSDIISTTLTSLPIPKVMQYQLADGTNVSFVRPAHGLVALLGADIVPAKVLGLNADRLTHGHRFQGAKDIQLAHGNDYEQALRKEGHVIASLEERRSMISDELHAKAKALGASLGDSPAVPTLIDEVNALVEWPAVYVGQFEETFLSVPQECLILSMRTNQKYFPLFDAKGKLLSKFLLVSNMTVADPSLIVDGNERVVRPRLADARFFFEQDKKTTLASRIPALEKVIYHAKLGTQADRSKRVASIVAKLEVFPNTGHTPLGIRGNILNPEGSLAKRAALIAKTDLLTGMVGEFPELQGLMGTYYARHDNEPEEVCTALTEQYLPKFSGDQLPVTTTGIFLALSDKLETLCGMFGVGAIPTGDRDPFALRRHALGVIRILMDKAPVISLSTALDAGFQAFSNVAPFNHAAKSELKDFITDRLSTYIKETGASSNEVAAVLAIDSESPSEIRSRLAAVREFAQTSEAASLAAANKRISNLLKKVSAAESLTMDDDLFTEDAEKKLAASVSRLAPEINKYMENKAYGAALLRLAEVRNDVDAFFAEVMVMDENLAVRSNRLALLSNLHFMMNRVADISMLAN